MREGHGGGTVRVRVGDDKLEFSGLRVEGAYLTVAPARHYRAAGPSDAHTEALQVRHLDIIMVCLLFCLMRIRFR